MTENNSEKELNEKFDDIYNWKEIDHWFSVTENITEPYGDKFIFGKRKGGDIIGSHAILTSTSVPNIGTAFAFTGYIGYVSKDDDLIAMMTTKGYKDLENWHNMVGDILANVRGDFEVMVKTQLAKMSEEFLKAVDESKAIIIETLRAPNDDVFDKLEKTWIQERTAISLAMDKVKFWGAKWDIEILYRVLTSYKRREEKFEIPKLITFGVFGSEKTVNFKLDYTKPKVIEVTFIRVKLAALAYFASLLRRPLDNFDDILKWRDAMNDYGMSDYLQSAPTAKDIREKWIKLVNRMIVRAYGEFQLIPTTTIDEAASYVAINMAMMAILNAIHKSATEAGEKVDVALTSDMIAFPIAYKKLAHPTRDKPFQEWWILEYSKLGYPVENISNAGSELSYCMIDPLAGNLQGLVTRKCTLDKLISADKTYVVPNHFDLQVVEKKFFDPMGRWQTCVPCKVTRSGRIIPSNPLIECVTVINDVETWFGAYLRKYPQGNDEMIIDAILPGTDYQKLIDDLGIKKGTIGIGKLPRFAGRIVPSFEQLKQFWGPLSCEKKEGIIFQTFESFIAAGKGITDSIKDESKKIINAIKNVANDVRNGINDAVNGGSDNDE